jgi:hypothetical protein
MRSCIIDYNIREALSFPGSSARLGRQVHVTYATLIVFYTPQYHHPIQIADDN